MYPRAGNGSAWAVKALVKQEKCCKCDVMFSSLQCSWRVSAKEVGSLIQWKAVLPSVDLAQLASRGGLFLHLLEVRHLWLQSGKC